MSYTGGVVELPITKLADNGQGDIQLAVGVYTGDTEALFAAAGLNKWAKYKPVKNNADDYESQLDANGHWKSTADWWKGRDGQCGLSFTTYPSLGTPSSGFFAALLAGLYWGYDRPTPGGQYPLRVEDFIQYYAAAPAPISGIPATMQLTSGGHLLFQFDENRGGDLSLSIADFAYGGVSFADYYAGVLVYSAGIGYTFATGGRIGDGNITFDLANMTPYGGRVVTMVPFLSSVPITQGIDPGGAVFLSADVAPQSVTINAYTQPYTMTTFAQWSSTLYISVLYDIRLFNNTGTAVTGETVTLKVYRSDQPEPLATRNRTGIDIPANDFADVQNLNLGIPISDVHSSTATYTLVVTTASGHWSDSVEVEAPRP